MNQPMDDMDALMKGYMVGAMVQTVCGMMLQLIFTIIPQAKESLKKALDCEPTNEDWEDYCQYMGELNLVPKCLQRAENRKKIRRLVFGEGDSNPVSN